MNVRVSAANVQTEAGKNEVRQCGPTAELGSERQGAIVRRVLGDPVPNCGSSKLRNLGPREQFQSVYIRDVRRKPTLGGE